MFLRFIHCILLTSKRAVLSFLLLTAFEVLVLAQTTASFGDTHAATELVTQTNTWNYHAQSTWIDQANPSFNSPYSGTNSFESKADSEHTFSISLFLGYSLSENSEIYYNPELFQGYGLSHTLGIAGFPNGEAVKAGFSNLHYNTSRLFIRHTWGLGGEKEKIEDDVNQIKKELDINRITFSIGKFSANDFFDDNTYSHDPRTQFMNWALWESAAWDYPADIVGFTAGTVLEWNTPNTTLHYGFFMDTYEPNGLRLDTHIDKTHAQILQYDIRYSLNKNLGTVRIFTFWNKANMGLYQTAAQEPYPSTIITTRSYRSKIGTGLSWDQQLTDDVGTFARLSWNDGKEETWAFTDVDQSLAAGLNLKGKIWNRTSDVVGLAYVVNSISSLHQKYLSDGGLGMIIGDGALAYKPEQVIETYYNYSVTKWLTLTADFQFIENPGYNASRGPVPFYAVRGHVQF